MKKYIYIALAAAAVLSGCAKEAETSAPISGSADTFKAVVESGAATKVTLDENDIKWESEDEISVNGVAYKIASGDGTTSATFEKKDEDANDPTAIYKAFYACGSSDGWDGTNYTLPAEYTYTEGRFYMPMYAQSNSRELTFKNLCGVLALSLTNETVDKVTKTVISSDSQLNGAFTADAEGGLTFSGDVADGNKVNTMTFSTAVELEATAKTFYIPVAPGDHQFTVKVYDGSNKFKAITMKSSQTFAKNTVYTLSGSGTALKLFTGGSPSTAR